MKNTISNININKETLKIRDNDLSIIFKNTNYIKKRLGKINNKKIMYIGCADGAYIKYLNVKKKDNLICIEKNKKYFLEFKKKNPGYKILNINFLKIKNLKYKADIIFSFSLLQYFNISETKKYHEQCKLYLTERGFCINMSIPNINKRFEYIFYRLKNFKYSFFGFLFDFYNLIIKNYNQKFSADNSFWKNPSHFSKSRIFLKSDSFYRFDYKFYKSTRFDFLK